MLKQAHQAINRFIARYPIPYLTSFALVVLRKPVNGGNSRIGAAQRSVGSR